MPPIVYFSPATNSDPSILSVQAKNLLTKVVDDQKIKFTDNLPLKIHPGAIGNTAYLRPQHYAAIISYLQSLSLQPYFTETCMASENSVGKEQEFKDHGLTQIPYVIADGPTGDDQIEVTIKNGRHFHSCMIARQLAEASQVLVINHFKGHGMAGFGGAVKMLGIGFASGRGKTLIHSLESQYVPGQQINWDKAKKSAHTDEFGVHDWDPAVVATGSLFRQRVAEYATAAAKGKNYLYLTFAINFSADCDCIDQDMKPLYPDLGVFASTDPVAIDRAVLDLLSTREKRTAYTGSEILDYAESLGLGSTNYQLVQI